MQNIIFKKIPQELNDIILPTDRPYFFAVLPVDQKINSVSSYKKKNVYIAHQKQIDWNIRDIVKFPLITSSKLLSY